MNESAYRILGDVKIEKPTTEKWEKMLDTITGLFGYAAALVMRVHPDGNKVLVTSACSAHIYHVGDKATKQIGVFCDTVVATRCMLIIPDALMNNDLAGSLDLSHGISSCLGYPIFWPDGSVFGAICALDDKVRVFTDNEVNLLGLTATVIGDSLKALLDREQLRSEIERQTRAAQALRESEERFRKVFELSPTAIMITTASEGRLLDVNDACLKLFGVSKQELLGKKVTDFPMYGDPSERRVVLEKLRPDGKIRHHLSSKKTSAGVDLELDVSVDIIRIGDEQCLIATLYDLTEQNKLERQLIASEVRLRRAQQMARVGNWEYDPQGNLFWASEESLNMYGIGYDSPFADAKMVQGAVLPEDRPMMDEALRSVLDGGVYNVQFRIKRLDNDRIRVLHSVAELGDHPDDGRVIVKGVVHDITDYVNTEQRLIESERRYKALFEDTSAVQLVVEMETGVIEAANPAAFAFYGYSPEELVGQSMAVINGLSAKALLERLYNAYNRVKNYHEVTHRLKSGEQRWVASFSGPIDIDGRKFVSLVVHDITDRNEAEKKLRASETRYRNLFHNNAAVQIIIDSDTGKVYDANDAACAYYGMALDDIQQKSLWDLNPSGEKFIRANMGKALEKGTLHIVTKHRRGDGEIRDVEVYSGRVDLDSKKLLHAIIHDVTQRTEAQKALEESEKRFRLFVENAPDGVFVQTRGCFNYVNRKTVEMFGASTINDLIGRDIAENFAEDFKRTVKERIQTLNLSGQPVPLKEEVIVRTDGSFMDVEVSAVPFCYQGENGALVFMRDISERRDMEKEREAMEAQLRQKQKMEAIGTLAGGVAHEINNPVTGIINYAQLITESAGADGEIRTFCGEIIYEGRRIAEIVSSLLKFSRQEKNTHSPAQINDIVTGTLSLTRMILKRDQIALEVNIPDGLPSIKCRSQQIQQVLMNLITNARDALNAKYKGFSENKRITISGGMFEREGRRWLRVTVEDRGTGIPADVMDKIFNPFFTTKPRDLGTGLGLSISHGIVREHHGELYFETTPGEFTKAVLELPVDNGWNIV